MKVYDVYAIDCGAQNNGGHRWGNLICRLSILWDDSIDRGLPVRVSGFGLCLEAKILQLVMPVTAALQALCDFPLKRVDAAMMLALGCAPISHVWVFPVG
jgi:hypothetical protein